jgi:hypothetical protein
MTLSKRSDSKLQALALVSSGKIFVMGARRTIIAVRFTVSIGIERGAGGALLRHALSIPFNLARAAFKRTDARGFLADQVEEFARRLVRHVCYFGESHKLLERPSDVRRPPIVVNVAEVAAHALEFLLDFLDQGVAGGRRSGWGAGGIRGGSE